MNILFLSTIFPDTQNPSRGTFNFEMCRALKRAGVDVRVIAPRPWPEVIRARMKGQVGTATEGTDKAQIPVTFPTYWYPPKVARSAYGYFYWRSIRADIDRLLPTWRPDFVLSYWAHPDGAAGLKLATQLDVPAAVIVGGSDVLVLPQSRSRKRAVVEVLRNSDAVLTVSQGLADVAESLGAEPERVIPLYQGVDPERFQLADKLTARKWLGMDPSRPLLIWVGRMVPVKNLDMLIAAAEIKANRGDDFVLCLLGDGPERSRLAELVKQKGLERIISFVGSVGHEELPTWYQAADLTVLCSHSEGLPNVFRESLACGTPFVSTNVGSIAEIADPSYSILVPPGDVAGLAAAIDQALTESYPERAWQTQVRTWDNMADEILEIADALIHPPELIATSGSGEFEQDEAADQQDDPDPSEHSEHTEYTDDAAFSPAVETAVETGTDANAPLATDEVGSAELSDLPGETPSARDDFPDRPRP